MDEKNKLRIKYKCSNSKCGFRWSILSDFSQSQIAVMSVCICGKIGVLIVKKYRLHQPQRATNKGPL